MWRNHLVICGFGRVASCAAELISDWSIAAAKILVLDRDPAKAEMAQKRGFAFILGDATSSEALRVAQVTTATAVFVCVGDAAALPIIRRVHNAAPHTPIAVVLEHKTNEKAARRHGAGEVFVLSQIAGRLMADSVLGSRGKSVL